MYVDDIVVIGNDEDEISSLKRSLTKELEIKDLGSLKYFLGIAVAKAKQCIILSQRKYVLNLLESSMEGCKPCAAPIEANHRLKEDDSEKTVMLVDFKDWSGVSSTCSSLVQISHT